MEIIPKMKKYSATSAAVLVAVLLALLLSGCGKKRSKVSTSRAPSRKAAAKPLAIGTVEEGMASWYGVPYHGRQAANGEIYDMEKLVAAHRTMPFDTWVKVTNLSNRRAVTVRIIDRGPFVGGRIIDLSKAAARQIELLGPGVGKVRLEVVNSPVDIPSSDFYSIQVGAFTVRDNAERLRVSYQQRFGVARLVQKQGRTPLWRVLVGKEASVEQAQRLADQLRSERGEVFIVRYDDSGF